MRRALPTLVAVAACALLVASAVAFGSDPPTHRSLVEQVSGAGVTPDVLAVDGPSTSANEALPEALAVLPVP